MLPVLRSRQRRWRVCGYAWSGAAQNPGAPSPTDTRAHSLTSSVRSPHQIPARICAQRRAAVGQVLSAPLLHFPVPLLRRARHALGRESPRLGPRQNLKGLGHLAAGRALKMQPRHERLDARGLADLRRNRRGPERRRLAGAGAGLGDSHRHRPRAGEVSRAAAGSRFEPPPCGRPAFRPRRSGRAARPTRPPAPASAARNLGRRIGELVVRFKRNRAVLAH